MNLRPAVIGHGMKPLPARPAEAFPDHAGSGRRWRRTMLSAPWHLGQASNFAAGIADQPPLTGSDATLPVSSPYLATKCRSTRPVASIVPIARSHSKNRPPTMEWMMVADGTQITCTAMPSVPRQLYLPIWRQSVLPVHLLGLAPLLGCIGPVAGDVKLQDDGVVHHPVNRRGGGHGVGKDAFPLREDQV